MDEDPPTGNKTEKEQIDHVIQDTEGDGGDTCRQIHHILAHRGEQGERMTLKLRYLLLGQIYKKTYSLYKDVCGLEQT